MTDYAALERHGELVAAGISSRVERIHDALASLGQHMLSMLEATPAERATVDAWIDAEGFAPHATGFFVPRALHPVLEGATGIDTPEFSFVWGLAEQHDERARYRMFVVSRLRAHLRSVQRRLPSVVWGYYTDAIAHHAAMVVPWVSPTIVPSDFDWHTYHSHAIVAPDVNPERETRWSPPNIDYAGAGLISCVSRPVWRGDEMVGVFSLDVRLADLYANLGVDASPRRETLIVSSEGEVIAHPGAATTSGDAGSVHRLKAKELGGDFAQMAFHDLVRRGSGRLELRNREGERLVASFRAVPSIDWVVVTTAPHSSMIESINSSFMRAFERVGGGDFSSRIDAQNDENMQQLANAYNGMVSTLEESLRQRAAIEDEKKALALQGERMARELEIAANIQRAMLPGRVEHAEFEFAGRMIPADEVGGDFYGLLANADGDLWITVGDVSSHGLGAGLVMMITQTVFESLFAVEPRAGVDHVLRRTNEVVYRDVAERLGADKYVTAQVLRHRGSGAFECAGSHLWPIVLSPGEGTLRQLEIVGPWIGVVPELTEVPVHSVQLRPGEVMVLYSDGIIEAASASGEPYDLDRFCDQLRALVTPGCDLDAVAEAILESVARHAPRQDDDRTILFVRRR